MTPDVQDDLYSLILLDRGIYPHLEKGEFHKAIDKAKGTWASFAGSGYGQAGELSAEKQEKLLKSVIGESGLQLNSGVTLKGENKVEKDYLTKLYKESLTANPYAHLLASILYSGTIINHQAMAKAISTNSNKGIEAVIDDFFDNIL